MDLRSLRNATRKHVQDIVPRAETPACLSIAGLSESIQLDFIIEDIHPSDDKRSIPLHEDIVLVEAYLRYSTLTHTLSALRHVQDWAANAILPFEIFAERAPFSSYNDSEAVQATLRRLRAMYLTGLRLLSHLQNLLAFEVTDSTAEYIMCLASFTDKRDPWTSPEAFSEANLLLGRYFKVIKSRPKDSHMLLTTLLQENIKPLFVASRSKEITEQGRKAVSPLPGAFVSSDLEATEKPWKFRDVYVVTVVKWVLEQLDTSQIETNWPLIIPPLLTMVDDSSTAYKVKGCEILTKFLKTVPTRMLECTGLGEVFQSALMPYLLYLPTLTPEKESLQLLSAVYPTLIALVNARFAEETDLASRTKAFDQVFRYGVLKGYAHAGENVRIAEFLVCRSTDLIKEMGIASMKHLKYILPLLSGLLTAPFATAYPRLLQAALQAFNAIFSNGWSRVAFHRGEILEGLIESINVKEEYRVLIDSDSRLRNLLIV